MAGTRGIERRGADREAPLFLTAGGWATLAARIAELENLAGVLLAELGNGNGDDVTAAGYGQALEEAGRLTAAFTDARPIEEIPEDPLTVVLGDMVTLGFADGTVESYVVVHPVEARFDDVLISSESPLGRALLGRRVGEAVVVEAPAGRYECTVLRAQRG